MLTYTRNSKQVILHATRVCAVTRVCLAYTITVNATQEGIIMGTISNMYVLNNAVVVEGNELVATIHTELGTLGLDYSERNDVTHEDFAMGTGDAVIAELEGVLQCAGFSTAAVESIMAAESGMGEPGEHFVFDIGHKLIEEARAVLKAA